MVKVGAATAWKPPGTNNKCNKGTTGPECEL